MSDATARERNGAGAGWIRRQRAQATLAWTAVLALSAAGLAGFGGVAVAGAAPTTSHLAAGSYLVRAENDHLSDLTADLAARGVSVQRTLAIVDSAVVQLSAEQATALQSDPLVHTLSANAAVTLASSSYDAATDANSAFNAAELVGAHTLWSRGITGRGVDIALIDSGVSPVEGLSAPGQIVYGPDLSFESGQANTRNLDTYGHGTAMAGLIVAHDAAASGVTTNANNYQGVAPGARIVSVKVADALGRTDVSQVIAGIDWVVQHAKDPGMNIRILNLSFGTDSTQSYKLDPLAYAAEVAWRHGIIVVASSGNGGGTTMAMPAADPFLIAVGALDTNDTVSKLDDVVASFTSKGTSTRGIDVLAPGTKLQSLKVPGSYLDGVLHSHGLGGIDSRFVRGSGTSQAAAVTSGTIALLLQNRPNLTPDQVKAVLKMSPLGLVSKALASTGHLLDSRLSADTLPPLRSQQTYTKGTGYGTLQGSRGTMQLSKDGTQLIGEVDVFGRAVNTRTLAADESAYRSWSGDNWNKASWAGSSFAGASWASDNWQGASWTGAGWAGAGWAGAGWAGAGWAGRDYS